MPAAAELWDLYENWKRLTEAEGVAIRAANWVEVHRCQRAKEQLQPLIVRLTEKLKAECGSVAARDELDARIREHVNELIVLESGNQSTLEQAMSALEAERAALDKTSQCLRNVHRSYVPAPAAVWNHYS